MPPRNKASELVILPYVIAVFGGLCLLFTVLMMRLLLVFDSAALATTSGVIIFVCVTVSGFALVANVALDALGRYGAKIYLSDALENQFDPVERNRISLMLARGTPFGESMIPPVTFDQGRPTTAGEYMNQTLAIWTELLLILQAPRVGPIAAEALFQRSTKGRLRYFDDVQMYGKMRRRKEHSDMGPPDINDMGSPDVSDKAPSDIREGQQCEQNVTRLRAAY